MFEMSTLSKLLIEAEKSIREIPAYQVIGHVEEIVGVMISARLTHVKVGEICRIESGDQHIFSEVVGFRQNKCMLMPYGFTQGLRPDAEVVPLGKSLRLICGNHLLGQVLNGLGEPLSSSNQNPNNTDNECSSVDVHQSPPNPLRRKRIETAMTTGIPAIDGFLTLGMGQRIGVFAAAGTGKSTLMGNIARRTSADVTVICLIGERGREVREFIEDNLGENGLSRSVVVVSTSDQPAILRLKSAYIATAIAEYFRDKGKNVLLMMDSVTRFARALREIGLARGESPARAGYPPSVFAELPRLLERSGTSEKGSITALYTVLVAGDDLTEPVADEVMSILDGHIILSRKLANQNQYPAIDLIRSKSRIMNQIVTETHIQIASELLSKYALYESNEDAFRFGFYESGKNKEIDSAVELKPEIDRFLYSTSTDGISMNQIAEKLIHIAG